LNSETKKKFFGKILEELNEVKIENDNIEEEIGDLLFSVINLARYLNIDPAHALFISYDKFGKRVERFKALDKREQKNIDRAWEKIKKRRNERETNFKRNAFAILSAVIGLVVVSLFTHNWNFLDLIKSFKLSYIIWAFRFIVYKLAS